MTPIVTNVYVALHAETAADLMVEGPVSIREDASVHDAIVLFTKNGISAAPVIDAAGRPVGVISRSDVIVHDRTKLEWPIHANDAEFVGGPAIPQAKSRVAEEDTMRVADLMTPAIFSVSPTTSARRVIEELLGLNVHRLFVVENSVMVGVISPLDILRHLRD